MIGVIIAVVIIVILLCAYISIGNKLARAQVKIDEAESGIDVALTKRYDLLTKQLDIAKGYAKHEIETLTNVINLRKGMSMNEKAVASGEMDKMQQGINVVAEAYPELKSSENFKTLQNAVSDAEEHLQAARRVYNSNVSSFNQMLVSFPSSVIANSKGYTKRDFFEAEESKKEDVKMEF